MSKSKKFFLIATIFFPTVFGLLIPYFSHRDFSNRAFIIGAICFLLAFIPEKIRHLFFMPIEFLSKIIGHINQTIILGFLFFFIFTPIALIRRIKRKDLLNLNWSKNDKTYWREPENQNVNFDLPY